MGRVFDREFAFDCETALIDESHPWITPPYVLGAAFDGDQRFLVQRNHAGRFFDCHRSCQVVMHHASFDLAVIAMLAPAVDIYSWVDRDLVWDTELLHRLLMLGTEGHTASGKGQSTLAKCTRLYLGVELPKDDVKDVQGRQVRTSYGQWLGRPSSAMNPIYLDYLCKDVIATWRVYQEVQRRLERLLDQSHDTWAFISKDWLDEQSRRRGPQTHHIQVKAAVALSSITANGLRLNLGRRDELVAVLQIERDRLREGLRDYGFLPGKGSQKALQAIFSRFERSRPGLSLRRTETGKYATDAETLGELVEEFPFVAMLLQYRTIDKLLGAFLDKMAKPVIHPSFNVLARTGRTTSFGEINSQNLPRDDRIRSCFVPSPGHVFVVADFKTIEMATLAQACVSQFGLTSRMAEAINAGKDLHTLLAAKVTGKAESEVTAEERRWAKPINFGKPGGMGHNTLRKTAKTSYGLDLTEQQVAEMSEAWFVRFPEMREFLDDKTNIGAEIAALFELTPQTHLDYTGDRRFYDHPENQHFENVPHPILGWMLLKTIRDEPPQTNANVPYAAADIDFFWSRVQSQPQLFPQKLQEPIRNRRASKRLYSAARNLVGRRGVFTLTGRLRAAAAYCARHNTIFQGLAADGAKLALWQLYRAGYRIVNFVHDEAVIEVPAGPEADEHASRIRQIMIDAMKEVVPDIAVDVEIAVSDRWSKTPLVSRNVKDRLEEAYVSDCVTKASSAGVAS